MPVGTLKKRKRRNITKVGGLSVVQYEEYLDTFDGYSLFTDGQDEGEGDPFTTRSQMDTRIHMNSGRFRSARSDNSLSSRRRVTRNPDFHFPVPPGSDNGDQFGAAPHSAWSGDTKTFSNSNFLAEERSHFIDKASMNRLRSLLLIGAATLAFPWKWNSREWRIDKWNPTLEQIWKLINFLILIQTLCITVFQIYSFVHQFSSGSHETYRETFMSSFSVCWYLYNVYYNVNLIFYKEQIRQYINTMLSFNNEYVEKYLIHLDDFQDGGRIIINVGIPTNCIQILASCVLFLVMPYQPWYLFSYIYPRPWYWLIPGAIQEFIVVGQTLTSYLLVSWIVVAHCNTVQFWLGEIHNHNSSDYTTDNIRRPKVSMETYKSLQILCAMFNECMAPMAIPMTKITVFTALIPCGYVLIRSMNHLFVDEFPGNLTYPLGVIDCATVGFGMMTMAAQMHDLATSFIDSWSMTKNKNFRRLLMSLPCLKVKVARFYFITVSTTITFFQVIFDLITDAIITFP